MGEHAPEICTYTMSNVPIKHLIKFRYCKRKHELL